ncbi:MAG: RsmE family RNA methyltransferase, partial [Bacteroidota bacterium]
SQLNILLDPGSDVPLARYFPAVPAYSAINILIGPEGGFAPEEVTLARAGGWEPVNLGPRILRTETSGVLAAGAILIATQI